jgi:hypothetical protein
MRENCQSSVSVICPKGCIKSDSKPLKWNSFIWGRDCGDKKTSGQSFSGIDVSTPSSGPSPRLARVVLRAALLQQHAGMANAYQFIIAQRDKSIWFMIIAGIVPSRLLGKSSGEPAQQCASVHEGG